jgi:hypothetical protein
MSVPEVQRKCVAGVRTTAHGPDQNNAEPVEHVGSREQIGPGLSQPGTAARDTFETCLLHRARRLSGVTRKTFAQTEFSGDEFAKVILRLEPLPCG